MIEQEAIHIDVLIVGAGPAGVACAIQLAKANNNRDKPMSIMVLEKGASLGAHSVSGAILDPSVLNQLLPNWPDRNPPQYHAVTDEAFLWLGETSVTKLPIIPSLKNHGNVLISLSQFMAWFGEQAIALGVDIMCGFTADALLYEDNAVVGVMIGAKGDEVPAMPIRAKQTILAEGARGFLSEQIIEHFNLRQNSDAQTYALGVKEVWKVPAGRLKPGKVMHTTGFPLDNQTYGGGFVYHLNENEVALGQIIGLDYANPTMNPSGELQRFKTHPVIKTLLEDGECVGYGARVLNEGGWQALPQCAFPGGLLVGCAAGTLNVGEMKGIHHAMQAGMIAADTLQLELQTEKQMLASFDRALRQSPTGKGLKKVRNIRPAFALLGRLGGFVYAAVDQMIFRGKVPWTLRMPSSDYANTQPISKQQKLIYPKPDGKLTFSKADLLFRSGVHHQEGAASHLIAKDYRCHKENNAVYGTPEIYYCPADVYHLVEQGGKRRMQIQSQNCLHCKACDIKNVHQNIEWTPPQGGDGPNYRDM